MKAPSLCLETFFTDRPFLERLPVAREAGFRAVGFWSWKDKNIAAVGREARRLGLEVAAFSANRRFTLIDPMDRPRLIAEVAESLETARRLGCRSMCLLSDRLLPGGRAARVRPGLTRRRKSESLVAGLKALAPLADKAGVTLMLEPLNTRMDHPGCFLDAFEPALKAVQETGHPGIRLLYDVYHMAMMGEPVLEQIRRHMSWIAWLDVADAPGRHEPGTGRVPYGRIAALLRRRRFQGRVGFELFPKGDPATAARQALELFSPQS